MGTYMASAGVDSTAMIWSCKNTFVEMGKTEMEMRWCALKSLRGHFSEISDVAWSRDEKYLVTASIDNSSILWNVEKSQQLQRFEGHKNYVSGVTVDPFFKYIITQSTDKTVKVMKNTESKTNVKFYLKNNIYKRRCLLDEEQKVAVFDKDDEDANDLSVYDSLEMQKEKKLTVFSHRMFLDDTEVFSFSRRLEFSPDGSFFIVPCGVYQTGPEKKDVFYVSYGFIRNNISEPAFVLPSAGTCPLVIRFHPGLFERKEKDEPFVDLPYIMVFAIATQDQIIVYTTRSQEPYAIIGNIHYAELTDLSWSNDKLLASSRDGFVTLVSFDDQDLGTVLTKENIPDNVSHLFEYLDLESWKTKNNLNGEKNADIEQKVIQPTFTSRKNKVQ